MRLSFAAVTAAAILAVTATAQAQNPTAAHLAEIDLTALDSIPTGVAANGADAYVVTFTNRRVIKVEDAISTAPSATVISRVNPADVGSTAPIAGTNSWATGRGLISADYSNGRLLVAGQSNTVTSRGAAVIIDVNTGNALHDLAAGLDAGSDFGVGSGVFLNDGSTFLSFIAGTNYWGVAGDLQSLTKGFTSGPNDPLISEGSRDMVATLNGSNQQEVYIAYNTAFFSSERTIGLHRITDTNGDGRIDPSPTDTHDVSWFKLQTTNDANSSVTGTAILNHTVSGKKFVALANRGDATVILVNTLDNTDVVTLDVSPEVTTPGDIAFTTVGGSQYMLVTEFGGLVNSLHVFGLNGATLPTNSGPLAAENWQNYE
jgi:hypothetical protein